ncbi:phosphoribosyl-ATP diphosphatase [Vibrio phage BUCT194]|uniref:Phosphoribosyl-ATP diphosphatase n=1 Tax=Vibrio phage BUCT194 TaxID=2859072 RepID=A0AAE9BPW1_9CAUD|nr:nucleotide pyrophosphohydrolase [Vibrio phage BUCT194]UAW01138.1 phosphoribosyl-ATP diphosphatase [Vibrio phage BUCT194]
MDIILGEYMNTNLNAMFDEFNETYGYNQVELNSENLAKSHKLIQDEVNEIDEEVVQPTFSKSAAIKEMIDNIYITAQQLRAYGVDIDAALKEVHRSNLSKTVPVSLTGVYMEEVKERYPSVTYEIKGDRAVLRCMETNKVIKPSIYSPAVITPEMYDETA